jgi:enoyl-CoA hydratase/carnithine racemase
VEELLTSLADGVLTVTMNRPARKNALTGAMYERFAGALEAAEHDPAVRAVLICGVPGAFSAGNDLQDFLSAGEVREARPAHLLIRALTNTTLPLVAAVDGVAVGIGTTMLLHCDFVYASSAAKFALSFINLGLCPEAGSSLLLTRLAGYQKAAELLLLGETFDVQTAQSIGLVGEVLESAALLAHAQAVAAKLAAKPRAAMRISKALLRRPEEPLAARVEAEIVDFTALLGGDAAREIMGAFLEKRAPDPARSD